MSNLVDLVTNPIDAAKQMITDEYFRDGACDAALVDFAKQFSVAISGEFATVHHPLAGMTLSISVHIALERP